MERPEASWCLQHEKRSAWLVYCASALALHICLAYFLMHFHRAEVAPRTPHLDEKLLTVDLEGPPSAAPEPPELPGGVADSAPEAPPSRSPRSQSRPLPKVDTGGVAEAGPQPRVAELTSPRGTEDGSGAPAREAVTQRQPLSLDQLGVGKTNPLGRLPATRQNPPRHRARRERTVADAEAALQSNIAESITRLDQYRGLGPEGPVLAGLVKLARNEPTPVNSHARFEFATDSEGRLTRVTLLQTSSDARPWRRIAAAILEQLRGQKLRLADTGRGVIFTVKVEVRAALPSGADPGFGVNVLGIPLKKGDGPRSAHLDILNLNPMALSDPTLGTFGAIVLLRGDVVDIAAPTSKQTHAHIESIRINNASGSAAPSE